MACKKSPDLDLGGLKKASKNIHHPLETGLKNTRQLKTLGGSYGDNQLTKVPIMTILTGRPFHRPAKPISL